MELTCPKCHATMRSYERSGIIIDQCTECRGVFLDRGELDKLLDAEAATGAPAASDAGPSTSPPTWGTPEPYGAEPYGAEPYRTEPYRTEGYRDDRYRDEYREGDRYRDPRYRRKKRSFLEDLFDD